MKTYNSKNYIMYKIILTGILVLFDLTTKAQTVISLYNGNAPGSEDWQWTERDSVDRSNGTRTVWNVSQPTLSVFSAATQTSTGIAVIICPGGGFQTLFVH